MAVSVRNPQVNPGNVGLGQFGDLSPLVIFGSNPDVDIAEGDAEIVNFDGVIPYPTVAQTITIFSDDAADDSTLIASGTISRTTTTDEIFSDTDLSSVQKGDIFINLTNSTHGFVLSIVDDIPLVCPSAFRLVKSVADSFEFYRPASTGGAVLLLFGLGENYLQQREYIPLDGVTPVVGSKTFSRLNFTTVIGAGSNESNVGNITSQYTVLAATIALVEPNLGNSHNAIFTVPADKIGYGTKFTIGLFRTVVGGLGGRFKILSRSCAPSGGDAWSTFLIIGQNIEGANPYTESFDPIAPIPPLTDIKFVVSVSDNNSEAFALMQFYLQDLTP